MKGNVSPFTLKYWSEIAIEHRVLQSKPDDIGLIATTIRKEEIKNEELIEIVEDLHNEFINTLENMADNVMEYVKELDNENTNRKISDTC